MTIRYSSGQVVAGGESNGFEEKDSRDLRLPYSRKVTDPGRSDAAVMKTRWIAVRRVDSTPKGRYPVAHGNRGRARLRLGQHVHQFEPQDSRIDPVETGPLVFRVLGQHIEKVLFLTLLVPKNELLSPFVEDQVLLCFLHSRALLPCVGWLPQAITRNREYRSAPMAPYSRQAKYPTELTRSIPASLDSHSELAG
jgi:hypothetical protein